MNPFLVVNVLVVFGGGVVVRSSLRNCRGMTRGTYHQTDESKIDGSIVSSIINENKID